LDQLSVDFGEHLFIDFDDYVFIGVRDNFGFDNYYPDN